MPSLHNHRHRHRARFTRLLHRAFGLDAGQNRRRVPWLGTGAGLHRHARRRWSCCLVDHTQRDASGYLTSPSQTFMTSTYAITTDRIDLGNATDITPWSILGTVRIRATATNPKVPMFIGIGRHDVVDRYLSGVSHVTITSWTHDVTNYRRYPGTAPAVPPVVQSTWVRSSLRDRDPGDQLEADRGQLDGRSDAAGRVPWPVDHG